MSLVALEAPGPEAALARRCANPAQTALAVPTAASPRLLQILAECAIPLSRFETAASRAATLGGDAADELVANGDVTSEDLSRAIAQTIGLSYATPSQADLVVDPGEEPAIRHVRTCTLGLDAKLFVAPRLETIDPTAEWLLSNRDPRIFVATPESLRAHSAAASMAVRLREARLALAAEKPGWSARTVMTSGQGYAMGVSSCVLLLAAASLGTTLWTLAHATVSLLFFAYTLFRLAVLLDLPAERRRAARERRRREDDLQLPVGRLPVYTVLVAIYREEEMVGPLVDALSRLNWPRSRLDVKLICEADDPGTIAAVRRRIGEEAGFDLVCVPPSEPRTKPKALNHALPLARGEFVVLYDAEDRPDPDQLLEAWLAFSSAGPDLACVQAPLAIRNAGRNWLTAMFALEYAVLFRAVLPFLARRRLPIPLGGTSNHFRRRILCDVGAWDSHNVAEDADLGVRLARFGYRTDVIAASTSEIAPERLIDWRRQRSRWIKGWIQTYLVHMRRPAATLRELGPRQMASFQLLFFSMVAGAVMHSVFVAYLALAAITLAATGTATLATSWLMAIDAFNIVAAALVFAALVAQVATQDENRMRRGIWALWLYWFLVSVAGVFSVVQLFRDPHRWEKTPHHEHGAPLAARPS